jgi:paraquat-inducible protein B
LHLQAKLIDLERKIERQDEQARQSNDREARASSRTWETLMENAADKSRREKDRVESLEELSVVLKEYCMRNSSSLYHPECTLTRNR